MHVQLLAQRGSPRHDCNTNNPTVGNKRSGREAESVCGGEASISLGATSLCTLGGRKGSRTMRSSPYPLLPPTLTLRMLEPVDLPSFAHTLKRVNDLPHRTTVAAEGSQEKSGGGSEKTGSGSPSPSLGGANDCSSLPWSEHQLSALWLQCPCWARGHFAIRFALQRLFFQLCFFLLL